MERNKAQLHKKNMNQLLMKINNDIKMKGVGYAHKKYDLHKVINQCDCMTGGKAKYPPHIEEYRKLFLPIPITHQMNNDVVLPPSPIYNPPPHETMHVIQRRGAGLDIEPKFPLEQEKVSIRPVKPRPVRPQPQAVIMENPVQNMIEPEVVKGKGYNPLDKLKKEAVKIIKKGKGNIKKDCGCKSKKQKQQQQKGMGLLNALAQIATSFLQTK